MSDAQRTGRRRGLRWVLLASAVLLGACVVAVALTRPDPVPERSAGPARPTPSPPADLARLAIERGPFCADLDRGAVREALGAPVLRTGRYGPGQRVLLAPGLRDVAHEYTCAFRAGTGALARVWVFAEPVTGRVARALAREATSEKGCRPARVEAAFGEPSAATVCPGPARASLEVVLRGLFGDAWLSCALTTPVRAVSAGEVTRRTERWCVEVATGLGGR